MKGALYDSTILNDLDAYSENENLNLKLHPITPSIGLKIRPLCISDYDAGYTSLLTQLTYVGNVSVDQYNERFNKMKSTPDTYYVTVIEDETSGQVVAAGTLLIEQKFIHNCALRGRIEDIVVNEKYRGKKLGKLMVHSLTLLAQKLKCYKVTLDCRDEMKPFYQSLGFSKEEGNSNFMQIRFRK